MQLAKKTPPQAILLILNQENLCAWAGFLIRGGFDAKIGPTDEATVANISKFLNSIPPSSCTQFLDLDAISCKDFLKMGAALENFLLEIARKLFLVLRTECLTSFCYPQIEGKFTAMPSGVTKKFFLALTSSSSELVNATIN